jgi:hypothetical protein
MAGGIAALNAMSGWPREYLSLGLAVKQTQKRPRAKAKPGDFSGVFDEFACSGGEEWI